MLINMLPKRRKPMSKEEFLSAVIDLTKNSNNEYSFDQATMTLAWTDGPSVETTWERLQNPNGWKAIVGVPSDSKQGENVPPSTLFIDRSFSPRTVCSSLVRFYGSKSRYPDLNSTSDMDYIYGILRLDVTLEHFKIVDAITNALLERTTKLPSDTQGYLEAANLALKEVGYEALWAKAFNTID
ncbi:hypothetical protein [Acidithrix sp. C25]|nr:hypothetical protein [Acidithrix sp. C25]CAG4921139.1 unnamed protein product [Acidithrix sp. C25]